MDEIHKHVDCLMNTHGDFDAAYEQAIDNALLIKTHPCASFYDCVSDLLCIVYAPEDKPS